MLELVTFDGYDDTKPPSRPTRSHRLISIDYKIQADPHVLSATGYFTLYNFMTHFFSNPSDGDDRREAGDEIIASTPASLVAICLIKVAV